ncbi:hypothetical protein PROFUN_09759 [Planoprotostelium fungivorum]|uniref:Uncharacterized protein n=1 Tax=Planoprotostelium fungivorum TaxID=1890364 RepID=A0A2P6NFD5_9EUKA|nr:hypothetical protein PROFUN_09759 [Planoprotostelium fungivorum]
MEMRKLTWCGFNESLFIKNDFKPKKAKFSLTFLQVFQLVNDVKCWTQQLNSRSNLALILGVLKQYCSAEESDDPYNMHLWSQIDPIVVGPVCAIFKCTLFDLLLYDILLFYLPPLTTCFIYLRATALQKKAHCEIASVTKTVSQITLTSTCFKYTTLHVEDFLVQISMFMAFQRWSDTARLANW